MAKKAAMKRYLSLSPVSVSSTSEHSRVSSISPPRMIGSFCDTIDGPVRVDHREFCNQEPFIRRPRNSFHTRNYRSRSRSQETPPNRYRSRSRSNPKSYRSRSSSRSQGSRHIRSQSRGESFRNWRHRSRSPSGKYRNKRSRSPNESYSSKSSSRRFRKSSSRSREYRIRRSRSRSESNSKSSNRQMTSSRSREHSGKGYKSKSPPLKLIHDGESIDMRSIWETFQTELSVIESMQMAEERRYDKDPEKHPDYKSEWKKFYKSRVQEILSSGGDPKLHNFESGWAYFWKFRMSELIKMEYEKKKIALKRRLKLPDDAEVPLYLQVKDSKDTVVDSRIPSHTANTLPSSKKIGISKGLIATLRIVTAVEGQLGSLGPQVVGLLSEAVSLQRISGGEPESLLSNSENFNLLETVKEKLIGQMQSNIVKKSLEAVVKEAVTSIHELLKSFPPPNPLLLLGHQNAIVERSFLPQCSTNDSQVNVPGIGVVDRIAIAQQIADALIKQGKMDVSEAELQELVNGVVGMAEAQAIQERERQIASLKEGIQIQAPLRAVSMNVFEDKRVIHELPVTTTPLGLNLPQTPPVLAPPLPTNNPPLATEGNDALNILMSVVKSGIKKADPVEKSHDWSSDDSDEVTVNITSACSHVDKNRANDSEDQDKNDNVKVEFKKTTGVFKRVPSSEKQGNSTVFGKKEAPKPVKSPSPEIFRSRKERVMLAASKVAKERTLTLKQHKNKNLSPFSSREETSNPLPNSEEEDEDLKVIGAWDSDSDIDLDSFGKTKGLAYDTINVKKVSRGKNEKKLSLLNKSKEVVQKTHVVAPKSDGNDINLDAAIDNLMGELKSKTSKIEVIADKPQPLENKPQYNTPLTNSGVFPNNNNIQSIPFQAQLMPVNNVVTTQGYNVPYYYPQPQSYGSVQQGYYSNPSAIGYTQSSGEPYYTGHQGATASNYYSNSGNMAYYPTNTQWQGYYGPQQTNIPTNLGSGSNYGKY